MQNAFLKKADLKNILVEISLMVHKDSENSREKGRKLGNNAIRW